MFENSNVFWYICGGYVIARQGKDISTFVRNLYCIYSYFDIRFCDLDRSWEPRMICLYFWGTKIVGKWCEKTLMNLAIPMVWKEPENHTNYLLHCMAKGVHGTKITIIYIKQTFHRSDDQLRILIISSSQYPRPWCKVCYSSL